MFINLKDLKQNIGSTLRLTLNSSPVREEKEWQEGTFNVFNYRVLSEGLDKELSATDSLKRKIDLIDVGSDFFLSWEEFTKEGQIRNYWKVESAGEDHGTTFTPKHSEGNGNEFKAKFTPAKPMVNGARNGMLFNQTMEQFRASDSAWSQKEFVENFNRISDYLEACENQPEKPIEKLIEKPVESKVQEPVTYKVDDLPF